MKGMAIPSEKLAFSVLAVMLSGVFIFGAFYFSESHSPAVAEAVSSEEALRAFATKDTDLDGLPDWQESLYGTDPSNAHSADATLTDSQMVAAGNIEPKFTTDTSSLKEPYIPGEPTKGNSLTDRFSRTFFEQLVSQTKGEPLTDSLRENLLNSLLVDFTTEASKELTSKLSLKDISTSRNADFSEYIEEVENIINTDELSKEDADPLTHADNLINKGDDSAKEKLLTLAKLYTKTTQKLLQVTVPEEVKGLHLSLTQAFDTLSRITTATAHYGEDPLATLGSFMLFTTSVHQVSQYIVKSSDLFTQAPSEGEAGYIIYTSAQYLKQHNTYE